MMEAKHSSKTLVLTKVTQRHIPEGGILQGDPLSQLLFKLL
jgi:hypothetical protein